MVSYLETLATNRELSAVLLLEHRSLQPEFRSRHIPRRDRYEYFWRNLIQEGIDAGLFTCIDTALAGRALLGVLSWTITWYHPDGQLSPDDIADRFADLFLQGLLVRGD
jgi:hypothetical protein